ncbi:MAG: hypothetical protein K0S19_980, partial [Geminicoccaceae bacterium]|nr:hypothetical protein [Geminicoccaceae bacterium]
LLLMVIAGTLAAAYLVGRPRLTLHNRLAAPIRVTAGDAAARTLAPRSSARIPAPWGKSLLVSWELVRPLSADGVPMGEAVKGSLLVRQRWGTIERTIEARGPHGDYFAPLITNGSPDLLRVRVNAGLEGALDCRCAVRPDARRAFIGYYRLYQNSTVQAADRGGRSATFRDLGSKVLTPDGSLGLRFDARDLRAPD